MTKEVNLDAELEQAPEALTFEIPMVRDTPPGWSSYPNMPGKTWYERALAFEKWCGHPAIPLAYLYDKDWNIVPAEQIETPESEYEPMWIPDEDWKNPGVYGFVKKEEQDGSSDRQ